MYHTDRLFKITETEQSNKVQGIYRIYTKYIIYTDI